MASHTLSPFPEELLAAKKQIRERARSYGLDFYDCIFEVCDYDEISEIAALGGFPNRYPHWRFGMEYERLRKQHHYGLGRIYEMVINNDPCYAYLQESNPLVDQKLVIAHVYGHCDFFKNNLWFSQTNRKMMDEMANHATHVRKHVEKHGNNPVERWLDVCLSLEHLIDPHSMFLNRGPMEQKKQEPRREEPSSGKLKSDKDYMDRWINPPSVLAAEEQKLREERAKLRHVTPARPTRDVLAYLLEHERLDDWQADCLSIVREESYYYAPQAMTKVMNEGWASFWHSTLMTKHFVEAKEVIDYADHHSGTVHMPPGNFNPYKIGIELFRDIEDRWNKGKFGKEYEESENLGEKKKWDKGLGLGRAKIFEVRKIHNDVTFVDTFLTPDFCRRHQMFSFKHNDQHETYEIESREFKKIKDRLLFGLTNFGQPIIRVKEGNYRNRGELYLQHEHFGIDLKLDHAQDTLRHLNRLWTRPVHIETSADGRTTLFSFDGTDHTIRPLGGSSYDTEPKDRRRSG